MCDVNIGNPIDAVATIFDPLGLTGEHGLGLDPFGLGLDTNEKRLLDARSEAQQRLREYDAWASEFTDPQRYEDWSARESDLASRKISNSYNAVGLAGSGADIGGQQNARNAIRQEMINRQLSDRNAIERTRQGYSQAISNMDIAKMNADNQALSSLMQGAGTVAGFVFGGPAGGMVGSQIGGAFGPDQIAYAGGSDPGMYFSESYGAPAGSDPYANWWNENNAPQSQYSNWWDSSGGSAPPSNYLGLEY